MERIVDFIMTRLFQMAEYVCGKCSFLMNEPVTPQKTVVKIRFTNEDKPTRPKVTKREYFKY